MTSNAIIYNPAPMMVPAAGQIIARQDINSEKYQNLQEDFLHSAHIKKGTATYTTYSKNLKQFWKWLQVGETGKEAEDENGDLIPPRPGHPILQPNEYDIDRYMDYITAKGCKANTATGYLRAVKLFFKWLALKGIYPDITAGAQAPKVDHSAHKKDALTVDAVAEIETSIAAKAAQKTTAAQEAAKDTAGRTQRATEQGLRLKAMYLLTVTAGLRTIEISRANIKDYERKGGQAWLYIWGKGRAEADQKKPLAREVAAALDEYLASRTDHPTGSSPLFVSTGNRSGGQRMAATTISTQLKRAMQAAGYDSERITAHSLRHTAGTTAMEITGNLYDTQHYMRHANPATTEIYLHNETEQRETKTAQQIYNRYHGIDEQQAASSREKLENSAQKLTPAQLEQLANIAAAMAG